MIVNMFSISSPWTDICTHFISTWNYEKCFQVEIVIVITSTMNVNILLLLLWNNANY